MKKSFLLIFTLLLGIGQLAAQAGKDTYQFLNLASTSRTVGFGGANVSILDGDINLAFNNPALLSPETHNVLTLNYSNYLADINFGSVAFGRAFGKNQKHIMGYGIHFIDYGTFLETTEADVQLGTFTAKDMALNIMYAYQLPKGFTVGATLKPIYSVYERYTSFGTAFDIGASYYNDSVLFSAGLVIRNIGWQWKGYYSIDGEQHRESLPLDIQIGISQRLRHAPIRFSMTLHNLQRWNLGYERSASVDSEYGTTNDVPWYDMMFRHTVFSVEIIPAKFLSFVASYNHRRRMEMNIPDFRTVAGFSFGAAVKVSKFRVGFAVTPYQVGALSYNFTLSTDLKEFNVR